MATVLKITRIGNVHISSRCVFSSFKRCRNDFSLFAGEIGPVNKEPANKRMTAKIMPSSDVLEFI
jgi:hypothetical protein